MAHEIWESGLWECPAVGKHIKTRTVHKGVHACGHCLAALKDSEGKQIPFTQEDWVKLLRGELNP